MDTKCTEIVSLSNEFEKIEQENSQLLSQIVPQSTYENVVYLIKIGGAY